jgi:hypothetical protein
MGLDHRAGHIACRTQAVRTADTTALGSPAFQPARRQRGSMPRRRRPGRSESTCALVRPATRHGQPPRSRAADRAPGASSPRHAKPAESRRSQSAPARCRARLSGIPQFESLQMSQVYDDTLGKGRGPRAAGRGPRAEGRGPREPSSALGATAAALRSSPRALVGVMIKALRCRGTQYNAIEPGLRIEIVFARFVDESFRQP